MWSRLAELPDLRRVDVIAIDTETNDEGLRAARGSSWPWHGGYICGVSVAYRIDDEVRAHYFPPRHVDSDNFDPEQVFQWVRDHINSDVRFITQNGLYDWGWLRTEAGISMPPSDRLEEVLALATLVDENRFSYNLDALCEWRGLPGKDTALLEEACAAAGYKINKTHKLQSYLWQLPAAAVGDYAEGDPIATLKLFEDLNPILDREGTRAAYRLECDLLPMVHEMRQRGIRIDQSASEQGRDYCLQKRDAALAELSKQLGTHVSMAEIASPKWKATTFDAHAINYPHTDKGNPSFKAGKTGWMAKHGHWLPQLIATANKYNDAGSKFFEGHILAHIVNGRIHGEIHPHRSEEGGTKSSRFSYSDPPLQQMPSRDPELGPLIRRVFLPNEGEFWAKPDQSQQEFRLLVHHAALRNLPGAAAAAAAYNTDPNADFHALVAEMTGLLRDLAKAVNFARIYGAGIEKFAEMIGKPLAEARLISTKYDQALPFARLLSQLCQNDAVQHGYTVLYDGARRHWGKWEAINVFAKGAGPCEHEEALRRQQDPEHSWFRRALRRYKTYTALNALIQGDAARHTKLWMRDCWREGIVPLLQMHDALDCSVKSREQGELVARLGCEAVKLGVPMRVDLKFGTSWGAATHTWEERNDAAKPVPAAPIAPAPAPAPAPAAVAAPAKSAVHVNGFAAHCAPPVSLDDILLADLVDEPVPRDGLIRCRFHDDNTPSLKIYDDHYHCFGCGAHGGLVDWLMQADGLEHDEAIHALKTLEGPVATRAPASNVSGAAENKDYALRLWNEARSIAGTLADRYLADVRRIDLDVLPVDIDGVLRFHPSCPFNGARHPCLLALMREPIGNAPTGVQRIALTPDARKLKRQMLGPSGVVKIWPAGERLVVGEGLETVLAAATRLPYQGAPLMPAWSALSDGGVERFPLIDGVNELILLADHDHNGAGQAAAEACKVRWVEAGRSGVLLLPERPDTDFNDIVIAMLGGAP